ncbi:hypothetical protein [Pedobacter sandarakinus]|uniref:hypothetical protein n=1 Tax=Pedobacter sandarakinus TaxID=353156 RepID=UPI0022486100|nr:hypothetical protein [Pedobacter sandarakinus]MCX2575447.1 hypothetical protein [Pedobacter sandarakinus]
MKKVVIVLLLTTLFLSKVSAQQLGLNFNHNPENIDLNYVKKLNVKLIRTTPRILDYVEGKLHPKTDTALQKVIDAGKMGYEIAFGFRWDFKARKQLMPLPDSAQEKEYFTVVDEILDRVAPYIKTFKLGNEPNLETMESDLQFNSNGNVPLVIFTNRLLQHVRAYYQGHQQLKMPDFYAGSLPALFEKAQQEKPGVLGLIKLAQENADIKGLAVHLHIADTLQIDQALSFVRKLMPSKPIVVPEFSMFRLYNKHFGDLIASSKQGMTFIRQNNLPADLKVYEWLALANNGKVPYKQWLEMFSSQDWYVPHYLNTFYRYYQIYHVKWATYPLFQQGYEKDVKVTSASWFLNPLFLQKTFGFNDKQEYYRNPLSYPDFIDLLGKFSLSTSQ